ncbi:MAG: hypothetical protein ABSG91_19445 [Syntrophobacteraceae bacterium]|jgi:hypothetical protein
MKKVLVMVIAVLFSVVGFEYACAQPPTGGSGIGGHLTTLNLKVTYAEQLPATTTLSKGKKLITVASGINKVVKGQQQYDPYLAIWFDASGDLYELLMSWYDPTGAIPKPAKMWTVACIGGNQGPQPFPGQPSILSGALSTKPQVSKTKPPITESRTVKGVASCYVCPDGFQFSGGVPTGYCNDGTSSYGSGYMTYGGTGVFNVATGNPVSVSLTGTVAGAGFYYDAPEWVPSPSTSCNEGPYSCQALFTGTFGATVKPCPSNDPFCLKQ